MGKVKRNRKSTAFLENLVICFFFTAPEASLGSILIPYWIILFNFTLQFVKNSIFLFHKTRRVNLVTSLFYAWGPTLDVNRRRRHAALTVEQSSLNLAEFNFNPPSSPGPARVTYQRGLKKIRSRCHQPHPPEFR